MRFVSLAAFVLGVLAFSGASYAKESCPTVKITCEEWCKRYNSNPQCMTGHGRSCEALGGPKRCVADKARQYY